MAKIIDLNDYRSMKQREFFINLYNFLNKNLDFTLDHILAQLDDDFIELCKKYNIDSLYVNFFRIPIITFIVLSFVNNSDIKGFFDSSLNMDNHENKRMFKNTLIKILETFDEAYERKDHKKDFEVEMEEIIEKGFKTILKIVPDKILLV